jgi:glycosyltransferase involved in cell wall biosynthesis
LALVDSYAGQGVVLHPAVAKDDLVEALRESRVMLYRGDLGETYCFAAAEAQAMGVPLVTAGVGSLAERLIDGKTGFLAPDEEKFAACSCRLLKDEALWTAQHKAALDRRRSFTWADAAAMWEVQFLKGLEK